MRKKPTRVCSSIVRMSKRNTLLRIVKIFSKGIQAVWFNTEQYSTSNTPTERLILKVVAENARKNIKKVGEEWTYEPSQQYNEMIKNK